MLGNLVLGMMVQVLGNPSAGNIHEMILGSLIGFEEMFPDSGILGLLGRAYPVCIMWA